MKTAIIRAYVNHFLPREVIGPVIVVFSLEGVIDGVFNLYVPDGYATVGWTAIFVVSLIAVAYWGTVDEPDREELEERLEEIQEEPHHDEDAR